MRGIALCCTFLGLIPRKADASPFEPLHSANRDRESSDVGYDLSLKIPGFRFITAGDSGKVGAELVSSTRLIRELHSRLEIVFISLPGDLAYPDGFSSVDDPAFSELITKAFDGIDLPLFPILGDNDYGSEERKSDFAAYIHFGELDRRWMMRNYYYHEIHEAHGISMCAVHIDTQSLVEIRFPDYRSSEEIAALEAQLDWLQSTLSSERCQQSDWIIVFGHHPLLSTSRKGNKGTSSLTLRAKLLPIFTESLVDAYFCGHDHDLQAITLTHPGEHDMSFIVSGATSRLRNKVYDGPLVGINSWRVLDRIGLTLTEVGPEEMTTLFLDAATGTTLHKHLTRSHRDLRRIKTGPITG